MPRKKENKTTGKNRNAGVWIALIGGGAAVLAALISPLLSDWLGRKKPDSVRLVDKAQIEKLEAISKKVEYSISPSPEARLGKTYDYYAEANQGLLDHYANLKKGEAKGSSADLLYLIGPAGAGKSTLTKSLRGPEICYVKLSEEFTKGKSSRYSVPRDDLKVGETAFNKLPGLADQQYFSLIDILTNAGCCPSGACKSQAILDDLDELHPDLSKYLLEVIESDLGSKPPASLPKQITVVGRPEGFFYYLTTNNRTPYPKTTVYTLKLPRYLSEGDLSVVYTGSIERRKDRNQEIPPLTEQSRNAFTKLIATEGWLSYTVSQLAYSDFIAEYVLLKSKEGQQKLNEIEGGRKLKEVLFDSILFYNGQSHHRPQNGNEIYVNLLEDIAVKYVDDAIKNNGYFDVPFEATIPVFSDDQNKTKMGTLSIREVLNRSGIAYLDPAAFRMSRYTFRPGWLHAYLVERWNERMRNHPLNGAATLR